MYGLYTWYKAYLDRANRSRGNGLILLLFEWKGRVQDIVTCSRTDNLSISTGHCLIMLIVIVNTFKILSLTSTPRFPQSHCSSASTIPLPQTDVFRSVVMSGIFLRHAPTPF